MRGGGFVPQAEVCECRLCGGEWCITISAACQLEPRFKFNLAILPAPCFRVKNETFHDIDRTFACASKLDRS